MAYKKYLHFITQDGNRDHILEVTKNYSFFDGIFAVVHKGDKSDDTIDILNERKGEGTINVLNEYMNRHDLSMNINLMNPKIQQGDWIFLIDTLERINQDFYPEIDALIELFEKHGMYVINFEGKTFFFRRNLYDQMFLGTPHWYLFNSPQINPVELTQMNSSFSNARINLRPQYRPDDHSIDHFVKYLWEFGETNHSIMEIDHLEFNNEEEKKQNYIDFETQRRISRNLAVQDHIPTTTLEFANWLIDNKGSYPDYLVELFKQKGAKSFRNFYRYHVLKEEFDEIQKTQFEWEFND